MKKQDFIGGLKLGLPIAIGYIPIAITFGLIIRASEIPTSAGIMMSFVVFAGASQFIGANLMMYGASIIEIVLTTFILNFRHFLMSTSLSQKVSKNTSKKLLSIISFGITDETFAVASLQEEGLINPYKLLGLNFIAYASWNFGTWLGIFAGDALTEGIRNSLGIALYAMFIGLLVPSLRKGKDVIIVTGLAIVINSIIYWVPLLSNISVGWRIIISTVIASFIGSRLFELEGEV
ncbi:4-azaleucine resistance transporter AzlC [Natranaerovirga pectinivora]|uniref:4-azaleucine resistance transporter AzlC n=1 Tax=Natranaerovirga pectinivora TaxID=682400 RepID=A0A4V6NZT0_9FIRM|nr:AzlC family ABC transporter permease [Natranaerovirga pectinivora]TCT13822.1 4-azaleucine resistance transporter AzlC [Natranaerovirga pectinivora]